MDKYTTNMDISLEKLSKELSSQYLITSINTSMWDVVNYWYNKWIWVDYAKRPTERIMTELVVPWHIVVIFHEYAWFWISKQTAAPP